MRETKRFTAAVKILVRHLKHASAAALQVKCYHSLDAELQIERWTFHWMMPSTEMTIQTEPVLMWWMNQITFCKALGAVGISHTCASWTSSTKPHHLVLKLGARAGWNETVMAMEILNRWNPTSIRWFWLILSVFLKSKRSSQSQNQRRAPSLLNRETSTENPPASINTIGRDDYTRVWWWQRSANPATSSLKPWPVLNSKI